jgi:hypothetical protein
MSPKSDTLPDPGNIEAFLGILREKGRKAGMRFRRVVINDDGSGEVEYEARNPWESLVIQLPDLTDAFSRFQEVIDVRRFYENAVIRKRCTKCFLHQREVTPADL